MRDDDLEVESEVGCEFVHTEFRYSDLKELRNLERLVSSNMTEQFQVSLTSE